MLATRAAVVADPGTTELLGRLPDWEADNRLSGHDSPRFAPNLLNLLADMGVRDGDDPRVGRLLAHQDPSGRFPSFGASRAGAAPVWGALLCDSHAVIEALVRYGRGDDTRARAGLAQMATDLAPTTQGRTWPCLPTRSPGSRAGPQGRALPQVTLRPGRHRHTPVDLAWVRNLLVRPEKRPSPFATAQLLAVLHRLDGLAAAAVDVRTLGAPKAAAASPSPQARPSPPGAEPPVRHDFIVG